VAADAGRHADRRPDGHADEGEAVRRVGEPDVDDDVRGDREDEDRPDDEEAPLVGVRVAVGVLEDGE